MQNQEQSNVIVNIMTSIAAGMSISIYITAVAINFKLLRIIQILEQIAK